MTSDNDSAQSPDLHALSGLEAMRWIQAHDGIDGPTVHRLFGMTFDVVEKGHVELSLRTNPDLGNFLGGVHGGVTATILDSAMGCAVRTMLDAGVSYTTVELHINYVRAAGLDNRPLRATGEVIHCGRRVATAEGKVFDERDKLVAHATTTCMIL